MRKKYRKTFAMNGKIRFGIVLAILGLALVVFVIFARTHINGSVPCFFGGGIFGAGTLYAMMNREFTNRRKGLLLDKGDAVFVTQPRQRNGFMIHATENGLVVSEYVVPKNES